MRAGSLLILPALFTQGCFRGGDVSLGDLALGDLALGEDSGPGPDAESCATGARAPAAQLALLSQAVGFGRAATGGASGCVYHVTSLADDGPGTLRRAAGLTEPAWIVFDLSGEIALVTPIVLASDKTIDGRGQSITVKTHGLVLTGPTANVVIENLTITNIALGASEDAIHVAKGAHTIWIDHCSLSFGADGLIDITEGSTDITVSWSHFSNHDLVMLIGGSAANLGDVNMRVTLHHNFWDQTGTYNPRLRFGSVHLFNNLIYRWLTNASATTMGGELYSEANIFVAASNTLAISTSAGGDTSPGHFNSVGDWLENGATLDPAEPDLVFQPSDAYAYTAVPADVTLDTEIAQGAGAR